MQHGCSTLVTAAHQVGNVRAVGVLRRSPKTSAVQTSHQWAGARSTQTGRRELVLAVHASTSKAGTTKGTGIVRVTTKGGTARVTTKGKTQSETPRGRQTGPGKGGATRRQQKQGQAGEGADGSGGSGGNFWSQIYIAITGFPFPLGPALRRNTVRYEVERDTIWTFEQTQALEAFEVYTPIRMTVIRLASGGLWVHNPLGPTEECVSLVKELGYPVEHIVLGTFAYEHKQFVGPFSRRFPDAKVWVTPYQWSYPLNLPPQFFGIFPAGELSDDMDAPWSSEIDLKLLLPPSIGVGEYVRFPEAAFFHWRTRSLIVTDAVLWVDDTPPDVIPREALLTNARDGALNQFRAGNLSRQEVAAIAKPGPVDDTEENRRLGWQRMALLVLFFNPFNLLRPQASFKALSNRLIVGPVVETLVYSKIPNTVRAWVEAMCTDWNIRQVIPTHFAGPVKAGPTELRRAFAFVYGAPCCADASRTGDTTGQASDIRTPGGKLRTPEPATQPTSPPAGTPLAASPNVPYNPVAALGRLFSFGRGAGVNGTIPQRAATFVKQDLEALNLINNLLLKVGAVKRLVD